MYWEGLFQEYLLVRDEINFFITVTHFSHETQRESFFQYQLIWDPRKFSKQPVWRLSMKEDWVDKLLNKPTCCSALAC